MNINPGIVSESQGHRPKISVKVSVRLLVVTTFLSLLVGTPASSATAGQSQIPTTSAAAQSLIPTYADSPNGLEKLMKDMLRIEKKGDMQALRPYMQALVLPQARTWFEAAFGQEIGDSMADSYANIEKGLPQSFPDTLSEFVKQKLMEPKAVKFTGSCSPKATEHEYPILVLRQNSQPLYDVRFTDGNKLLSLEYFAYVSGAFRYIGTFQVSGSWPLGETSPPTKARESAPKRIQSSASVQSARLVHMVQPPYPARAREAHMQGTVLFRAIITKDGSVSDLRLLQGQCWLAEAAIKAVKQWRYTPTQVEGKPVEVDTSIQVIFTIH